MAQQDHAERDLLAGNNRYKKLQDLNEGTFGVVMLALDTQAREQVRASLFCSLCLSQARCPLGTLIAKFVLA